MVPGEIQCCTCSKWVNLRYLLLSLSRFKTLGSSHHWSCPPSFWRSNTYQHCVFLFGLYQLAYFHCSTWHIWASSANAAIPSHPRLQISYSLSIHFVSSPSPPLHVLGCFSIPPASFFPLTLSGVFNGMLVVFKPETLNYHTLSCLILWTLYVFSNLTFTHFALSRFLNTLLSNLITPTPDLAFFLLMISILAVTSSFLLGRDYPSLNVLPPFFHLTCTLDCRGQHLTNLNLAWLSFFNVYAPSTCSSLMDSRIDSFFPPFFLFHKSHSRELQLPTSPLGLKR